MKLAVLIALSLITAPSFAKPQTSDAASDHVIAARKQIRWKNAGDEAVHTLQRYLATDTVNPDGNETNGVQFLGEILDNEAISWESVELGDNRSSLIARLPSSGEEPPLCLMHHIDVVGAEPDKWSVDPFAGAIKDGQIWGRGALDMKSLGVLHLMSMVWLKRLKLQLKRDVILLAVADEEVNNQGARQLFSDEHWAKIGCSHLLNEGGLAIRDGLFEGQDVHLISVAEKGVLWARVIAEGPAGHGSVQTDSEAPATLLAAMHAIENAKKPAHVDPIMYELLRRVGRHKGGITGLLLKTKPLVQAFVKPKLMQESATRSVLTNTAHLTGMGGGLEPNVVPSEAWAQYDCRLLPGVTADEQLNRIRSWTAHLDGITIEQLHFNPSSQSPIDDPVYEAIARYAVEDKPESVAVPALSVGFTDSLFARQRGVRAYGYAPLLLTVEEAETMHGHDERVSIENMHEGLRTLFSVIVEVAAQPAR